MTYTTAERVQDGRDKKAASHKVLAAGLAKHFNIHRMGDAHYVAIIAALLNGAWDHDSVTIALYNNGFTEKELSYFTVQDDLKEAGILAHDTTGAHFSTEFLAAAGDYIREAVRDAPARMKPLTEQPADWTGPYHEQLQMPLIGKNITKQHLESMTYESMPLVYDAINRLQRVAYKVPAYLIAPMQNLVKGVDQELKEINDKLQHLARLPDGTKGKIREEYKYAEKLKNTLQKKLQLLAQIGLIEDLSKHDAVYFLVTMDFRGRMYYRGGVCTPQGSDFQKAAFQFKARNKA